MKHLRALFPFLITVLLWRLAVPFWNPGGIIALVPVFYYSFIRPVPWFAPFAALFCFLIDYNSDTLLFWTASFCLLYAAAGFQNFIDFTRQKNDGFLIFLYWLGASVFILTLFGPSVHAAVRAIWLVLWLAVLYIPFTAFAKAVSNDR